MKEAREFHRPSLSGGRQFFLESSSQSPVWIHPAAGLDVLMRFAVGLTLTLSHGDGSRGESACWRKQLGDNWLYLRMSPPESCRPHGDKRKDLGT